ncbi:glutaredoxin [Polaribacter haliotis]|uniref:Glutaredoxin n=2 Tax=Polaribacter TaxID=52959 RepID=A0A7L8AG38_9FLAO|nr:MULTISPECIES: glutaredoxin domain-containing protein [Polaribacter]QNM86837.1 glutaredoxin [Polaribacter pectinis]QOD60779.1 glutaredoxin [Polaribacter haliotis]
MKITLYGRKGHAYTVAFKNFLNSTDIPYVYKDVALDEEAKKHTKELYGGVVKYPTLIVDEEVYLTPTTEEFNKIMQDLNLRA